MQLETVVNGSVVLGAGTRVSKRLTTLLAREGAKLGVDGRLVLGQVVGALEAVGAVRADMDAW